MGHTAEQICNSCTRVGMCYRGGWLPSHAPIPWAGRWSPAVPGKMPSEPPPLPRHLLTYACAHPASTAAQSPPSAPSSSHTHTYRIVMHLLRTRMFPEMLSRPIPAAPPFSMPGSPLYQLPTPPLPSGLLGGPLQPPPLSIHLSPPQRPCTWGDIFHPSSFPHVLRLLATWAPSLNPFQGN